MNIINILTLTFLFFLKDSNATTLNSKLHIKWSNSWRVQVLRGKPAIYTSIDDCNRLCNKGHKIDCLKVNKYEDQVKIVKEIFSKYYPNFIICYIDEDEALSVKSNFNENGGNNSSTNYKGFETLFHHQDICNSFCQSFHGRLCQYLNLSNNKKGYGCRYFNH